MGRELKGKGKVEVGIPPCPSQGLRGWVVPALWHEGAAQLEEAAVEGAHRRGERQRLEAHHARQHELRLLLRQRGGGVVKRDG